MRRARREKKRITVRRRSCRDRGRNGAGCAAPVFDDDILTQQFRKTFRKLPCDQIARPARRYGDDQGNQPLRVLGLRWIRKYRDPDSENEQDPETHGQPPPVCLFGTICLFGALMQETGYITCAARAENASTYLDRL